MNKWPIVLIMLSVILTGCKDDDDDSMPTPDTGQPAGVNADLADLPYDKLSDYNFFTGSMSDQEPNSGVLPYDLISHLFTDYAKKKRYVYMPPNSEATYLSDGEVFDFPVGTIIIKTFYYDNVQPTNTTRIMETRLLIRNETQWEFAEYIWNDEQDEALLDMNGRNFPIEFIDDSETLRSINYRMPSEVECLVCHKQESLPIPIGPKPQNLNKMMSYSDGEMHQLEKWEAMGYLNSNRPSNQDISTVVEWEDESLDLTERVRSYIDINCAHCHQEGSHCDYRPMRFAWSETTTEENLGVCIEPEDPINPTQTHIINRGRANRSMLYYRLASTLEDERMPILGRTIVHDEALAMMEEWINGMNGICD